MEFFDRLGALVGRLWKERNYDERSFPRVACHALAELPPNEHVSFWDAVKLGFIEEPLPYQNDLEATFGQPPLTTYVGRDFRIEVLFWTRGLPGIHQHAFSGGFHVMHGSSLHTIWNFNIENATNVRLHYGQLSLKKAELLERGNIRPIVAGPTFIHSTFHLDRPSVSVVVRTNQEPDKLPQYRYLFPSIAYDDKHITPEVQRRTQLLSMLVNVGKLSEFDQVLGHALATADAYSVFHFLLEAFPIAGDEDDRRTLLLRAKLRYRRLVEALEPALYQLVRRRRIISMRESVYSPDLQFFLALLLNIPERRAFFDLINQRYPSRDPIDAVVGWVAGLSDAGVLGEMRFNESWLLMLRCLLLQLRAPEIEAAFQKHYSSRKIPPGLVELAEAIRGSWLLQPLFSAFEFDLDPKDA